MTNFFLPLGVVLSLLLVAIYLRPGFPPQVDALINPSEGNRFAYLDDFANPYWVDRASPKLTTPQWIGEAGVEAAAVLSIDDMRSIEPYQTFIEPILQSLEAAGGRAPLSIFTNTIDPNEPQLQAWLKRGVSIEVHTIDHPCPLLKDSDFDQAKSTVHRCVDLLNGIPKMTPVTYRMPCCDSMNSVSTRFYQEILRPTTPTGRFLTSDSSVFQVFTAADPDLPRELFIGPDGEHRFTKYLPLGKDFVNHIADYPYPYLIGDLSWQFPCTVPSDWEAQYLQGKNNPKTIDDLKAAIDATVAKQGLFVFVFHPHGWIENSQVTELVEHAKQKHGSKLRFLSMADVQSCIDTHLLRGQPIRSGNSRVLDVNADGHMDVLVHFKGKLHTHVWQPQSQSWQDHQSNGLDLQSAKFGVQGGHTVMRSDRQLWHFDIDVGWYVDLEDQAAEAGHFRDLDQDGTSEWLTDADFPEPWTMAARLLDIDQDGDLDFVASSPERYAIHLRQDRDWHLLHQGKRNDSAPPSFTDDQGRDHGVWTDRKGFIVQNEHTASEPNVIKRVAFETVLAGRKEDPLLQSEPLGAQDSHKLMRSHDDLQIELVASEPLVMDPIDIAWGLDGKLWVVEMSDYPTGTEGGRVRYLEDTDQDGSFDKSTVFMQGIPYPTGVLPWGSGALVLAAPNLFYAEDANGDGEAEMIKNLYTGFGEGNQQHRANSLRWGLDNWVYIANGDSNGIIKSSVTGKEVNMQGLDVRVRPNEGLLELASGSTQHGRNHDDAGNWFGNNNSNPLWHFVLPEQYMRRNPHVTTPSPRVHLPQVPGNSPVFPTSVTFERFNDFHTANCITSACSSIIYRDTRLGAGYVDSAFICEPVHNLVHREVLSSKGVTFTSQRADTEQTSEFLTSQDPWFRPVACHTGPGGGLWVVDMYRHVIEHPEWIPHDWEAKLDLRAGHDCGRIYRITSKDTGDGRMPNLMDLAAPDVVNTLCHASGMVRDLAHQHLLTLPPDETVGALAAMATSHHTWQARLHALCVLDGLQQVDLNVLTKTLEDEHPAVRRHAMRIAPSIPNAPELAEDTDPKVNLQRAFSLSDGETLAESRVDDRFMRAAVLSAIPKDLEGFVEALEVSQREELLLPTIRTAVGMERLDLAQQICRKIDALPASETHFDILSGALALNLTDAERAQLVEMLPQSIAQARSTMHVQATALKFLAHATTVPQADLNRLIQPNKPIELQQVALRELAVAWPSVFALRCQSDDFWNWEPAVREFAKQQIQSRADIANRLMDLSTKPVAFRRLLVEHPDKTVRKRAKDLLGMPEENHKLLEKFAENLLKPADRAHGAQLFAQNCQVCHRVHNVGNPVGPDLTALTNPSKEFLVQSIVDPNEAVEDKYVGYAVTTHTGDAAIGLMESASGGSITLRLANGDKKQIVRSDIASLSSTTRSLMPEGFGEGFSPKDMHDLLGYLQGLRTPRKHFQRNEPVVVTAEDGVIRLKATQASVHGPSLTFEIRYLNLGNWCHVQDQAVWAFRCDKPGRYALALDFSCADNVSGDQFQFTVGSEKVTGKVPGTKNFNGFRQETFGELHLTTGEYEGVFRSLGPINQFLIDLREVKLTYLGDSE